MRTALYLRVSTIQQKPDLQADSLRRHAMRAGLEMVAEYLDVAISGRKEGRPQLQALMRAAHQHEFDCVLVWKFDRFARSVAHLLNVLEEFNHLGIRFIRPTVCFGVTSLAANTCGCDGGRIGPTRCALIDAARGDRWRTRQASSTSPAAARSDRSGLVGGSRPVSTAAPGGFHGPRTRPQSGSTPC